MENIKEALFKDCERWHNGYLSYKKDFGLYSYTTTAAYARFCALYQIIEDCKLEEEYQAWKESKTKGNDTAR